MGDELEAGLFGPKVIDTGLQEGEGVGASIVAGRSAYLLGSRIRPRHSCAGHESPGSVCHSSSYFTRLLAIDTESGYRHQTNNEQLLEEFHLFPPWPAGPETGSGALEGRWAVGVLAADRSLLRTRRPYHNAFLDHVDHVFGAERVEEEDVVCLAGGEDLGARGNHLGILNGCRTLGTDTKGHRHIPGAPFRHPYAGNLQVFVDIGQRVLVFLFNAEQ